MIINNPKACILSINILVNANIGNVITKIPRVHALSSEQPVKALYHFFTLKV